MADQSALENRLLSRLSPEDFALLSDHLEGCEAPRALQLATADEPLPFAYFLESGIASIVAVSPEGQKAEAGIIGRDGFVHPALVLGSDRVPHDIQIQIPGTMHRISCRNLMKAVEASATLQQTLLLFAQAYSVQLGFTSLSNAVHQVDERLARWLLMCHDRSSSDDLALTHEFMGIMLSVRRVSVTNALHVLEGCGYIAMSRGFVNIRNRAAIEEFAGDAYGKSEAEYRRLLGPM